MTRASTAEGQDAGAFDLEADLGWFVYAIADAGVEPPPGLTGIDGEPVQAVASGQVAALASRIGLDRASEPAADLLAFREVVDALATTLEAVAPVRFGSVLADRAGVVHDLLDPNEGRFAAILDDVRGRLQLTVQALYDPDALLREVVAAEPEIARLRERTRDLPEDAALGDRVRLGELVAAAVDRRRADDAALVLAELEPLAEHVVTRPVGGLERALDVALLVDRSQRDAVETRLEVLAEELHGRMRLRLLGPSAAYDFVAGA